MIKTHNGLIFDHINNELSYSYERNDVVTSYDNNKIYTVYYLWLNNRINYYERNYKRIQDIISSIGGIFHFITFVSIFINSLYNNYIVLSDTESLLNSLIEIEKQNLSIKKKIKRDSKKIQDIDDNKNYYKVSEKRGFKIESTKNNVSENKKDNVSKTNNFCLNDNRETINFNKVHKTEKIDDNKKDNKIIHNFWHFVLFKLSFEKKNISFKEYQTFRTKILSEEHLFRNHLTIYNLLRINQRKINFKKRYSYQLKDLIKNI